MKSKLNPISVGSFVIGGVILIVIGLISFQSISLLHKPIRFVSYFDESVQGLDVGSNVKLRGVAVGRVVAISVQYDWITTLSTIKVISELNKKAITDTSGKIIQISNPWILKELITSGLRAKVDLVGITGLQFVQLDFLNPKEHPVNHPENSASPYPIIPTVHSGMSKITDNLVEIADNFRKVDFQKLSNDFSQTSEALTTCLNSITQETKGLRLRRMSSKITSAAAAVDDLASFLEKNPSSLIFGRRKR